METTNRLSQELQDHVKESLTHATEVGICIGIAAVFERTDAGRNDEPRNRLRKIEDFIARYFGDSDAARQYISQLEETYHEQYGLEQCGHEDTLGESEQ